MFFQLISLVFIMNFEKGRIFSSLCCGALQHHGAIEVARRMHLIALNYNDNKIVQLNCDYRGFFDRVFKRKLISDILRFSVI